MPEAGTKNRNEVLAWSCKSLLSHYFISSIWYTNSAWVWNGFNSNLFTTYNSELTSCGIWIYLRLVCDCFDVCQSIPFFPFFLVDHSMQGMKTWFYGLFRTYSATLHAGKSCCIVICCLNIQVSGLESKFYTVYFKNRILC